MSEQITVNSADSDNITENDIVFECDKCGKSLVIDMHGAGLTITCPDCNSELLVPIPEGVDLTEIDRNISASFAGESAAETAIDTSALPPESQEKVQLLITELQELRFRRGNLERLRVRHNQAIQAISRQTAAIRAAIDQIDGMLENTSDNAADDTQQVS